MKEFGVDDPEEKDVDESDLQAGYDGDYYEIHVINLTELTVDDDVELLDGTPISVADIVEKL